MSATGDDERLSARLVRWMAEHRDDLDAAMTREGSRAIHEEFMMAEGGVLPDRAVRLERARGASARAWLRHLAGALEQVWEPAGAGLADRMTLWSAGRGERLEALILEEEALLERRGVSGDADADRRDVELSAYCRLFAEALAECAGEAIGEPGPAFARRVAGWSRANERRRREVEEQAHAAWTGSAPPGGDEARTTAAAGRDTRELRVREAAGVWSHVQLLAEALESTLAAPAEGGA